MKKETKGLGRLIFMEWAIPIFDYFSSLRKNEVIFEIVVPLVVAGVSTWVYMALEKATIALDALADILPSAISILIGFTVMFITLLLTSDTPAITRIKEEPTENVVRSKNINLYQKLHIQLTESLFAEVLLLLTVFCYLFAKGIGICAILIVVILGIEVYLTLHILLSIIRSTTHLYCVFYKTKKYENIPNGYMPLGIFTARL